MKTAKIIAIFMIVLFIVPVAFAMQEQKSQTSGIRQASCVIRIITERGSLTSNEMLTYIRSILHNSRSIRAARDILGYKQEDIDTMYSKDLDNWIKILLISQPDFPNAKSWIYTFKIEISAPLAPKPAAQEFMEFLIEGLKQSLNKSYEDSKNRLNQQVKIAEENAKNAEKEFYTLQEQMRKLSGLRDFSRRTILADINNLQTQIDRYTIEVFNSESYLEDLPKQIENTRKRIEEKLKTDAILIELENVVRILQKQFDSVKKLADYGQGPSQDLILAEEKLARAQLEVTRRKEELQRPSGRDSIDSLNDRIAQFSVMRAQSNKRLNSAQQQLDEARKLLGKADDYEVLSIKADIARSSLRKALENLADLKRNADIVPPTITVMGD